MFTESSLRMMISLVASLLVHGVGLLALGIGGSLFYTPAKISWAEGTSTIEVSVSSIGSVESMPSTPRSTPKLPEPETTTPKVPEKRTQATSEKNPPESSAASHASKSSAPISNAGAPTNEQPTINFSPIPPYPEAARQAGREGVVTMRVKVGTDGRVIKIQVLQSSGYDEFDDAALKTVKNRWRFTPAMCSGIPFESDKDIKVRFVLK